jgi:taurine transport system substrate-binding protein
MSSAPQFLAAMAGGSIDTCAIASSSIVTAFAEKLDVSLVYIEKVITTSEALIVRKAAGIAKLVDLKGRKIGTPFNTSAHFALLCILAKARLRAADVQIINMRPESLFATWSRAEIDAAYIWHPFQGQLVNAGGQILITTADLTDMGLSLFDGILVRNDFKRRCPEILLAYLKNYARTCETFRGQQAVVVQTLSAYLGVPNDVIRQYVSTFATLTPAEILSVQWMGPVAAHGTGVLRSLSAQADFLVAANQIEAAPKDLERFIDSSIAARIA